MLTVREAFEKKLEAHRSCRWQQRCVSGLYWASMLALGTLCASSVTSVYELALVVPAAYAADLMCAAVHIYLDHRKVDADGPVSESWILRELDRGAYGFQLHHGDPLSFVRGMKLTGQSGQLHILVLGTIPLAVLTALVPCKPIRITLNAMNMLASSTQVVHALTHLPRSQVPRAVRWAQEHGLLISRKTHARHHARPEADFAIVNGWCNPLVNALLSRLHFGPTQPRRHVTT
jgi:hypothetical protein